MAPMPPDTDAVRRPAAGLLRRAREARRRACRSWRTSPAAAASRASGSRRSASTTSLFGGRSPINDQNREFLAALARGPRRRTASTCRSTGATATGTRTSPTRCAQMAADGVTPGRLLRDQRLLVVLRLPAVPREPRRRRRGGRRARRGSTGCGTTSTTRASWSRWSTPRSPRSPSSPDDARDGAHLAVRHPLDPDVDERRQRARRRRLRRPAPQRRRRGRRAGPPGDRAPATRASWSSARAPARRTCRGSSPTSTTTSRSSPSRASPAVVVVPIGFVSDHMEVIYDLDTEAQATAEKARARRSPGPPPPGVDPRFVAMVRDLLLERAAVERGEEVEPRPRSARWPPSWDRCPVGCCPNPRGDTAGAVRAGLTCRRRTVRRPARARGRRRPSRPPSWSAMRRREGVEVAATKSSAVDVVTEADRASEELIRDRLLARPPRRRLPRRGGRRRGRHHRGALGRRPDRRHRQLPLRPPALRRLDRRRGRRRGRSPGWCVNVATRRASSPPRSGGGAYPRRRTASASGRRRRRSPQRLVGTGFNYERRRRASAGRRGRPRCCREVRDIRRLGLGGPRPVRRRRGPGRRLRRGGRCNLWDHAAGGLVAAEAGARARGAPRASAARDLRRVRPGARLRRSSASLVAAAGSCAGRPVTRAPATALTPRE